MCSFRGEPLIYPPCTGATHRLVSPHPRFHVGQSLAFVLQVWTIDYEFRYLILFCLFPKYYVICHSSSTLWNHNINTKHSVVSFLFIINYFHNSSVNLVTSKNAKHAEWLGPTPCPAARYSALKQTISTSYDSMWCLGLFCTISSVRLVGEVPVPLLLGCSLGRTT